MTTDLKATQRENLRVLVQRGCYKGLTALAKMLDIEDVALLSTACIESSAISPEDRGLSIVLDIEGVVQARFVLLLEESAAMRLASQLVGPDGSVDVHRSALQEIGNILGSAFITAIAENTSHRLMPSPPRHQTAGLSDILDLGDGGWVLGGRFGTPERDLLGQIVIGIDHDNAIKLADSVQMPQKP